MSLFYIKFPKWGGAKPGKQLVHTVIGEGTEGVNGRWVKYVTKVEDDKGRQMKKGVKCKACLGEGYGWKRTG